MSFFWEKVIRNYKKIFDEQSLRAKTNYIYKGKRMSRVLSIGFAGGMVIEASIALPIFLFFVLNILSAFDMLQLHGNIASAIHEVGNKMAYYGYAYKNTLGQNTIVENGLPAVLLGEGYARAEVITLLGKPYLDNSCLYQGASGLQFFKSSVLMEGDIVELIASYKVETLINLFGIPKLSMENRYYAKAWTGYDVEGKSGQESEDPMVFISETGSVYHPARNCSYLNPSISVESAYGVVELRNQNGGKYYACGGCTQGGIRWVVYVTNYGDKYHASLNCRGLKRTIYAVRLSEVRGKGGCSKCALR